MEYMLATKRSARDGVTITRTMNVRNKNIPSPDVKVNIFAIRMSRDDANTYRYELVDPTGDGG